MDDFEKWITTVEAVQILGVSEGLLRKWVKDGTYNIQRMKKGSTAFYLRDDIERVRQEREQEGK